MVTQGSASNLFINSTSQPLSTITQVDNDKVDNNKDETDNLDKNVRITSEGKTLTQPSTLNFIRKGVKREK